MRKIILTILLLFLFLTFSGPIQAVTDTIVEYPDLPGATKPGKARLGEELPEFIKYIFVFSLGAVGVTALIVMIIAAFGYVTSVGNPQKAAAAKDRIAAALLGMLLLLGSYLLLRTINPDLLRLGVTLEEAGVAEIDVEEGERKWLCVLEDVGGYDIWYERCYEEEDCEELCRNAASELGGRYGDCREYTLQQNCEAAESSTETMCECIQQVQSATNIPEGTSDTSGWCQQYVQSNCPSGASTCGVVDVSQNSYTGTWWCNWRAIWNAQFGPGPCSDYSCNEDSGVCLTYFNNTLLRQCSESGTTCSANCL